VIVVGLVVVVVEGEPSGRPYRSEWALAITPPSNDDSRRNSIAGGSNVIEVWDREENQTVAKLFKGEGFGDLALLNNKPRSASAYAKETSLLLVVSKHDYTAALQAYHNQRITDYVSFLQHVPVFQSWATADIAAVASFFKMKELPADQTIQEDHVFIIRDGTANIIKRRGTVVDNNARGGAGHHRVSSAAGVPIGHGARTGRRLSTMYMSSITESTSHYSGHHQHNLSMTLGPQSGRFHHRASISHLPPVPASPHPPSMPEEDEGGSSSEDDERATAAAAAAEAAIGARQQGRHSRSASIAPPGTLPLAHSRKGSVVITGTLAPTTGSGAVTSRAHQRRMSMAPIPGGGSGDGTVATHSGHGPHSRGPSTLGLPASSDGHLSSRRESVVATSSGGHSHVRRPSMMSMSAEALAAAAAAAEAAHALVGVGHAPGAATSGHHHQHHHSISSRRGHNRSSSRAMTIRPHTPNDRPAPLFVGDHGSPPPDIDSPSSPPFGIRTSPTNSTSTGTGSGAGGGGSGVLQRHHSPTASSGSALVHRGPRHVRRPSSSLRGRPLISNSSLSSMPPPPRPSSRSGSHSRGHSRTTSRSSTVNWVTDEKEDKDDHNTNNDDGKRVTINARSTSPGGTVTIATNANAVGQHQATNGNNNEKEEYSDAWVVGRLTKHDIYNDRPLGVVKAEVTLSSIVPVSFMSIPFMEWVLGYSNFWYQVWLSVHLRHVLLWFVSFTFLIVLCSF
jgi:hypothetical protein